MNKDFARQLIKKTFQNPFDKGRFVYFFKNLLNHFEDAPFIYRGNFIPDAYKPYIKTLERIGKYQDEEDKKIDLLIVYLKKEKSLERARTMQRNFIAWYLNGSRGDILKDAALVAFVAPNSEDWRFSLVKMDYLIDTSEEKVKVQQELTPARRFSFLVGKNESSHTAQSRLAPILQDDTRDPTFKELEDAFSIERVTKEFFEKYRELFLRVKESLDEIVEKDKKLKQDFKEKNIDTVDFAKKLLGQIVFLYFLQKKGWFGVKRGQDWGFGSKSFLRELFNKKHSDYKNFFNDILEPLFYEALRNDRSHDDHYFSMFKCKIPFLNGGLFDPINDYDWKETDILLSNELFSNENPTREGDIGDGILDIFDRYNFTVKEDEPLEKEVAVDPEMLGKVFENLLEVKDRKSKGTYYTPREIVHYMCQQSLINYLATELENKIKKEEIETLIRYGESVVEHDSRVMSKGRETKKYSFKLPQSIRKNAKLIDEKLESIRICDPAVGSGAFPVGMMNEIITMRNALTPYIGKNGERTPYNFKRHAIQNCLYGVDIDPGAVEIAKLRLWLSLIVDEEDIKQIRPLPNLDYKIMQGNSLIEILTPEFLVGTNNQEKNNLIKQLKKAKDELFGISSPSLKDKKKKEIETLLARIIEHDKKVAIQNLKSQIASIKNQGKLFADKKTEDADRKKILELEQKIQEIENIKLPGPTEHFEWHLNFSEIFREEKSGFDIMIANPPYDVYQGDRKGEIKEINKYPIYEKAKGGKLNTYKLFLTKSIELQKQFGLLCEIFQNSFLAGNSAILLRKFFLENQRILKIDSFPERDNVSKRVFENVKMSVCILQSKNQKLDTYKFELRVWNDRYMRNIRNAVIFDNQEILNFDWYSASIPLISTEELSILRKVANNRRLQEIAHCYEGEINLTFHKKFLRSTSKGNTPMIKGAAVQKWRIAKVMSQGEIEYLDAEQYLKMNKGEKSHHFNEKRIVMQGITGVDECRRLKMLIIGPGTFCGNSVNYIIFKNSKVGYEILLGILNSTLLNWYFKIFSTNSNVNGYEVNNLPIPITSLQEQHQISNLVDKILSISNDSNYLKNPTKQAKVREYEKQIDQLVYKLYSLTLEEIKIVEDKK